MSRQILDSTDLDQSGNVDLDSAVQSLTLSCGDETGTIDRTITAVRNLTLSSGDRPVTRVKFGTYHLARLSDGCSVYQVSAVPAPTSPRIREVNRKDKILEGLHRSWIRSYCDKQGDDFLEALYAMWFIAFPEDDAELIVIEKKVRRASLGLS